MAVSRRERKRIAEPEPVKLERERVLIGVVDLVRDEHHRLVRRPQDLSELLVAGRDAGARVDDEEHEVRLCDGRARLLGDLAVERSLALEVDAAGVDDPEVDAVPVREQLLAVAGDSRGLVDDGCAALGQAIDQRRLADVGEADDRHRADDLRHLVHAGGVAWRGRRPRS